MTRSMLLGCSVLSACFVPVGEDCDSSGCGTSGGASGGGTASVGGGSAGGAAASGGAAGLPAVMVVLEQSGVLVLPLSASGCACWGSACPPTCPTGLSVIREGLGSFFSANASAARFGLFPFPGDRVCGSASQPLIDLPAPGVPDTVAALGPQTQRLADFVGRIGWMGNDPVGGSPVGPTLRAVAQHQAFTSSPRKRGVILITDGVDNCNPDNPLSCAMAAPPTERCTLGQTGCTGAFCRLGYDDSDGSLAAVRSLRALGIRTAVVAWRPAQTLIVDNHLSSLAAAGEAACEGVTCDRNYFQAGSAPELDQAVTQALQALSR